MNEIIVKWNQIYTKGIILSTTIKINTPLLAYDQIATADSEDNLERERYSQLQNIAKKFYNGNINSKT